MTAAAILAVDGGNSKTDVALVDADGAVLGGAHGPGASHHQLGVQAAMETLEALVAAACRDAGLSPGERPLAEVGVWCLAGLDLPADDEALGPAVAARRWAREALLHNDVFAVLRAGTGRTWGVGVVVGAGMNCAGVAPDGREVRFPALGELSGDWGGGYDIGIAAVGAALRGEDGRGARTALGRLVPGHFELPSALAVVEAIFLGRIGRHRVLELAPLVLAAAEAGDPVAAELVGRQVDEVVAMAGAAIRRLGLTGRDVDVVLGGGLFHRDDPAFIERIRAGIATVAPAARLRQVTAPPVVGAALLGLDRLGARPEAAERLRATLTHERLQALQPVAASNP
ncbi:MAG TPA: BadF/BadG/BcrA/BcrD ATPase family protein [Actinomycetes bacterium]|nr:BadF/BadG/BcrA/BcrD ATPase family protein [Actinomycetes bacterium]